MNTRSIAFAVLAFAVAVPAAAQMESGMKSDKMMKMSAKDTKMMKSCQAMSHDKMMKSAGCKKMMKMHPDMMKGDMMMKSGG